MPLLIYGAIAVLASASGAPDTREEKLPLQMKISRLNLFILTICQPTRASFSLDTDKAARQKPVYSPGLIALSKLY